MQEVISLTIAELTELSQRMYGELVKAVVDIEQNRLIVDAEMHSEILRRESMIDRGIDREKWAQLTIFEQMGNIGSEVGRAINAKKSGKADRMDGAIDRAVDLFDATAEVWAARQSPRTREVLRAKEQFLELFFGTQNDDDAASLERYFMQFAQAARS